MTPTTSDGKNYKTTATWTPATPEEMVRTLTYRLFTTSKIHFIKRLHLRRNIEFWKGQL